jgi:hypothetical protein
MWCMGSCFGAIALMEYRPVMTGEASNCSTVTAAYGVITTFKFCEVDERRKGRRLIWGRPAPSFGIYELRQF